LTEIFVVPGFSISMPISLSVSWSGRTAFSCFSVLVGGSSENGEAVGGVVTVQEVSLIVAVTI
jgi:hypothetical protein